MTLNFPIGNISLYDNKMVVANHSLQQLYTIDVKEKTAEEYLLPHRIFSDYKVKELHFEEGSKGCYHADNLIKSYLRKGNRFVLSEKTSSTSFLPGIPNEIDGKKIELLPDLLDKPGSHDVSLKDLDITEKDIRGFKKFIDKEEQRIEKTGADRSGSRTLYTFPLENTDFNYYRSVADSLSSLSRQDLNDVFWQSFGNWSTTVKWKRIILEFQNNKKLIIENSDDIPNYLYTPWVVNFEGLKFRTNSILFGKQVNEMTNGQFFDKSTSDKKYAIFKIADYLYRKKREYANLRGLP